MMITAVLPLYVYVCVCSYVEVLTCTDMTSEYESCDDDDRVHAMRLSMVTRAVLCVTLMPPLPCVRGD